MPFFEEVEPAPEPEEHVEHRSPPWAEAPATVVPVTVALDVMVARTPDWAIWVGGASVTPVGMAFTLVVLGRVKAVDPHSMGARLDGDSAQAPRFGVGFADGRKVAGDRRFGGPSPTGDAEREIALSPRNGTGGRRRWTQTYWLWPLPPPGPLTFAISWPSEGIGETLVEVDAGPIRAAAARGRRAVARRPAAATTAARGRQQQQLDELRVVRRAAAGGRSRSRSRRRRCPARPGGSAGGRSVRRRVAG